MTKKPDDQGLDTYATHPVKQGEFYAMDLTGKRDGNGCCPAARTTLLKSAEDAMERISKVSKHVNSHRRASSTRTQRQVENRHEATRAELLEVIDWIRGAVMIGCPMGLPEWDPVRLLLENREGEMESVRTLSLDTTQL